MGFFGHVVAARVDAPAAWPLAERVDGRWVDGVHVWRVPDRLGVDWDPVIAFVDALVPAVPGGFLCASVFDSDGALVHVGAPGRDVSPFWLHVDGVVAHFLPPWAPFDDAGQRLEPEAEAAQDAEWETEAAAYRAELEASALPSDAAAAECRAWALAAGLEPRPLDEVVAVLDSRSSFVEETFARLLAVLGAASAGPDPDRPVRRPWLRGADPWRFRLARV